MAKPAPGWFTLHKRKRLLLLFAALSLSTAAFFSIRGSLDSSDCRRDCGSTSGAVDRDCILQPDGNVEKNHLDFMRSKLVLLVSHELSLSGGPLLLMELAFLLRNVGTQVIWITYQKPAEENEVAHSLEQKMLNRGVQVHSAKGQEAIDTALKADMIVLNTAVAGKWLDAVMKEHLSQFLPKILWWIHEMRGHYFILDYVKHLPFVAAAMIDSNTTAEYWKNRTHERLGAQMLVVLLRLSLMV